MIKTKRKIENDIYVVVMREKRCLANGDKRLTELFSLFVLEQRNGKKTTSLFRIFLYKLIYTEGEGKKKGRVMSKIKSKQNCILRKEKIFQ